MTYSKSSIYQQALLLKVSAVSHATYMSDVQKGKFDLNPATYLQNLEDQITLLNNIKNEFKSKHQSRRRRYECTPITPSKSTSH